MTFEGQMTLTDWCGNEALEGISEEQMVKIIGDAVGMDFKYHDELWGWEYKKGKVYCSLQYDNYDMTDSHRQFIGVDIRTKQTNLSAPCDSIDEAIELIKRKLEEL